jgi:hypothetical protein
MDQGPVNVVVSFGAMLLSGVTLYLTYFDAHYSLTGAMSSVESSVRRASSSEEGVREVNFQYYATPSFILAHNGSRPVVLTAVDLIKSSDPKTCVATKERVKPYAAFQTQVIAPGSVTPVSLEFPLAAIDATDHGQGFSLEPTSVLWCLQLTVFDQHGERHQPLMPAIGADTTFDPPTPDDEFPTTKLAIKVPYGPVTLLSKGRLF